MNIQNRVENSPPENTQAPHSREYASKQQHRRNGSKVTPVLPDNLELPEGANARQDHENSSAEVNQIFDEEISRGVHAISQKSSAFRQDDGNEAGKDQGRSPSKNQTQEDGQEHDDHALVDQEVLERTMRSVSDPQVSFRQSVLEAE